MKQDDEDRIYRTRLPEAISEVSDADATLVGIVLVYRYYPAVKPVAPTSAKKMGKPSPHACSLCRGRECLAADCANRVDLYEETSAGALPD